MAFGKSPDNSAPGPAPGAGALTPAPEAQRPSGETLAALEADGIVWEGEVAIVGGGIALPARLILTSKQLVLVSSGQIVLDVPRTWLRPAAEETGQNELRVAITPDGRTAGSDETDHLPIRIRAGRGATTELAAALATLATLATATSGGALAPSVKASANGAQAAGTHPADDAPSWEDRVGAATPMALPPLPDFGDDEPAARQPWPPIEQQGIPAPSPRRPAARAVASPTAAPSAIAHRLADAPAALAEPDASTSRLVRRRTRTTTTAAAEDASPYVTFERHQFNRGLVWGLRLSILLVLLGTAAYFGRDRLYERLNLALPSNVEEQLGLSRDAEDISQIPAGGDQTGANPDNSAPTSVPTITATDGQGDSVPSDGTNGGEFQPEQEPSGDAPDDEGNGGSVGGDVPTTAADAAPAPTSAPESDTGASGDAIDDSLDQEPADTLPEPTEPVIEAPPPPTVAEVPVKASTQTPVPTATELPTEAPTQTPAPSPTATATPAPSATATATATPTAAPTQTPAPSATATPTQTPAPSATATATATPTAAPTQTPAPSATATPTQTPAPSATATPTAAPTQTPAPSVTAAPTQTPAPSATAAPTQTPAPSVTAAPTQTPAPSATAAPTQTQAPSATATATATPTQTPAPSLTPTMVPEPTLESQPPSVDPETPPAQSLSDGAFRYSIEGAARGDTIPELPEVNDVGDYGEWVVISLYGENWTDDEREFDMSQFRLLANGEEILLDVGNDWVSSQLGLDPAYGNTDTVTWAPGESHQFALTFLVPQGAESLVLYAGDQVVNLAPVLAEPAPLALSDEAPVLPEYIEATVVDVVNGESIVIERDGVQETVRYLGVDAPAGDDCFAGEATAANAALVAGKRVRIERQATATDARGNWVRDVWVETDDGRFVLASASLVAEGSLRAGISEPNTRFAGWLTGSESAARAEERGLWGACEPEARDVPGRHAAMVVQPAHGSAYRKSDR